MDNRIDHEVPDTYCALIPIGIDLIVVHGRVRDQLNELAALKRHLLLQQLVLHLRGPTLRAKLTGVLQILIP